MVNDRLEYQIDTGSAQNINSTKYLIATHQTADIIFVLNKKNDIAVFDNLDARKHFCDIDGQRYPKAAVITNYAENE